jgi:hypothetical protein
MTTVTTITTPSGFVYTNIHTRAGRAIVAMNLAASAVRAEVRGDIRLADECTRSAAIVGADALDRDYMAKLLARA